MRGPGSFTGVRLALATAAGFSRATGALQAGLDYLPLLAQSAWALINAFIPGPAYIWALTHARRELVHLQGFEVRSDLAPIGEILVVTPFEAAEIIASNQSGGQGPALVLGSGLSRNRDVLEKAMAGNNKGPLLHLPSFFYHPDAAALLRAAETAAFAQKDIEPLYVRPSDAEENLESIAASLGLDPAQARKKLDSLLAGQEE